MMIAVEIATVMLVAIATGLVLAHALKYRGKLRLKKDEYFTTQRIYISRVHDRRHCRAAGLILLVVLLLLAPVGSVRFWLTAGALAAFATMHATYWLATHPVNNFWLKDFELKGAGKRFFSFDPLTRAAGGAVPDWTHLRDRWEHSHIVRAALGMTSMCLLVAAVAYGQ